MRFPTLADNMFRHLISFRSPVPFHRSVRLVEFVYLSENDDQILSDGLKTAM